MTLLYISSASAHDSHTHTAPWEACEHMKKSKQCAYINGDGDLFQGTCQLFSDVLMCVRNQPIIHVKDLAKEIEEAKRKAKMSQMPKG
jgi:hypothetical protein